MYQRKFNNLIPVKYDCSKYSETHNILLCNTKYTIQISNNYSFVLLCKINLNKHSSK